MVSSIPTNRILQAYKAGNKAANSTSQQPEQRGHAEAMPKNNESVQVSLSEVARSKLALSKAVRSSMDQQQQAKKARARERVAEVKMRIDQLKKMLMMFGSMASKALIRELKQLAGELKGAAKDLQEGGTASSSASDMSFIAHPDNMENTATADASVPVVDVPTEPKVESALSDEAEAVEDSNAETETADQAANLQQPTPEADSKTEQQQRQADQRLLQDAVRELQSLFNMLKAMLPKGDKDTEKQLAEISSLIEDTKQSAQQLSTDFSLGAVQIQVQI